MSTLEQITFETGRSALADQESLVIGILQRTGALLAAHALVASFLGASAVKAHGLHGIAWIALLALALGLVVAAVLLAPWKLRFAIDARELYDALYDQAREESDGKTSDWLTAAGFGYQDVCEQNAKKIRRMSSLSASLSLLMVVQTLAWLTALGVD